MPSNSIHRVDKIRRIGEGLEGIVYEAKVGFMEGNVARYQHAVVKVFHPVLPIDHSVWGNPKAQYQMVQELAERNEKNGLGLEMVRFLYYHEGPGEKMLISEYIPLFPMNALQQQAFEEEVVRQVGVLRSEGYNASRDMFQPRLKGRRVEAVITDFGQLKGNPLLDMTAEAAQNLEHGWEEFQSSWMSFLEEPEEKWSE